MQGVGVGVGGVRVGGVGGVGGGSQVIQNIQIPETRQYLFSNGQVPDPRLCGKLT